MTPELIGLIGVVVLILLLLLSMPIGFAMALVGFVGISYIISVKAAFNIFGTNFWSTFSSYSLTVIPLFVFMGEIAFVSGVSKRLYSATYAWLGNLRGGLAMATIGGCAGFAAICGSSPATAATMGTVALPEMKRYKYDLTLATGAIASGGTLGILIPPSVVLIIYGIQAQLSIGELFIAGILPGILLAFLYIITISILCLRNPLLGPAGKRTTLREKFASLPGAIEMIVLFGVVMGGLLAGWFTPTEAAGAGAGVAILICIIRRQLDWSKLKSAINGTLRTSCMILVIVAGAMIFSRFVVVTGIPAQLSAFITGLGVSNIVVLIIIMLIYIIGGCVIDALSFMIITFPFFYPVVVSLGFDPIWWGVILVILLETGAVTPPVGINVFVIKGIDPDIPIGTIFRGIVPFFICMLVAILIIIIFPDIALVLPNLMR